MKTLQTILAALILFVFTTGCTVVIVLNNRHRTHTVSKKQTINQSILVRLNSGYNIPQRFTLENNHFMMVDPKEVLISRFSSGVNITLDVCVVNSNRVLIAKELVVLDNLRPEYKHGILTCSFKYVSVNAVVVEIRVRYTTTVE